MSQYLFGSIFVLMGLFLNTGFGEKIVSVWSNYGTRAGHFCFLCFVPGAMLRLFFSFLR